MTADKPNRKQRRAAEAKARKGEGKTAKEAVLETVKRAREPEVIEITLTTGAKATLHQVSPSLIQDVQTAIPDPEVPVVYVPEKEREYENPTSPAYLAALDYVQGQRIQAVLDAQVMMGVELEEGFEVPDKWVKRLKKLAEKRGLDFDESDPDDVEFTFKKYGLSNDHFVVLSKLSGISEEDLERFRDLFRS
jgi:ABC-type uncharacterized transport system substrate-binding protein